MDESPPYRLEIRGLTADNASAQPRSGETRPWLGILFRCCGLYSRVYRNDDRMAYVGRCPGCLRQIHVGIGHGGTSERFFEAY